MLPRRSERWLRRRPHGRYRRRASLRVGPQAKQRLPARGSSAQGQRTLRAESQAHPVRVDPGRPESLSRYPGLLRRCGLGPRTDCAAGCWQVTAVAGVGAGPAPGPGHAPGVASTRCRPSEEPSRRFAGGAGPGETPSESPALRLGYDQSVGGSRCHWVVLSSH